jgi:hypothetical protein
MTFFRTYLAILVIILSYYTFIVVSDFGINLFLPFFGAMANITWSGQFNLDFMMMLSLSALWTAWRSQFSGLGFALAVLAFFGGALFLCVYLTVLSVQTQGDVKRMLIGNR